MLPWLTDELWFPDSRLALEEPNGLLAAGGDLSPERLITAYRSGIFPWFNPGEPILWWSPSPRCVLFPQDLHVSRSMRKEIRKHAWRVSSDRAFTQVMRSCAAPRAKQEGTWISEEMIQAYTRLHNMGTAHSIEIWDDDDSLIGGLYGLAIDDVFFGESMFSRRKNASKVAFITLVNYLANHGYKLIDCQVYNPHLESLGAKEIPRDVFMSYLTDLKPSRSNWDFSNLPIEIGEI